MTLCLAAAFLATLLLAAASRAQDFAPAGPAGPRLGAASLLERALPLPAERFTAECGATRWLGMPQLETRSAALLVPAGTVRAALGLSQTGDGELGWTCVAVAFGAASEGAGAALRAAVRRDREGGALLTSGTGTGAGGEAGAGAWISPARGWRVWAQAPQLWTRGEPPPLARPLELGARCEQGALSAWFAVGAPRASDDGERLAGVAITRGALCLWVEGRDGPVRGAVGLLAEAGPVRVAARIEGHPVLGETTQVTLALRRGAARVGP